MNAQPQLRGRRRAAIRQWLKDTRGRQVLTTLLVTAPLFLVLAVAIYWPGMQQFDLRVTRTVQELAFTPFRWLMMFFTFLGNTATLVVLALLVAGWLNRQGLRSAAILTFATLIGVPLNVLIKSLFGRPRPDRALVEVLMPTSGTSFPSGHAMGSTMLFGFLAALAWIHLRDSDRRRPATFALIALAFLISFSRIALGAHWFSDVVAGVTAGTFFLAIFVEAYRLWGLPKPSEEAGEGARREA